MPNTFGILSYNNASEGVRNIKEKMEAGSPAIAVKRLSNSSPAVIKIRAGNPHQGNRTLVHWGNTEVLPNRDRLYQLNNVNKAAFINKHRFFATYRSSFIVPFFTDVDSAANYVRENGGSGVKLVERQILDGHSGEGISLISDTSQLNSSARLWTVYKKKKSEYRVHFFKDRYSGQLKFYVQKKLMRRNVPELPYGQVDTRYKVRNVSNGWVYSANSGVPPNKVVYAATVMAVRCPLDFGAIDIIYNESGDSAWILEINTAPGVVESTAEWYGNVFRQYYNNVNNGDTAMSRLENISINGPTYGATVNAIIMAYP